ncbi:hypothetical protein ABIA39_008604 [Nocardia sp. GAS34]|uniref:fructose-bisphosphatase class II n=1 Tax=unclassified Nocardia TaxID=2637762 RepID=UPI003D1C21D3
MNNTHAALAATAAATAVAATYPFVGLGPQVKNLLDSAAAEAITITLGTATLAGGSRIRVAGCEGARDASPTVELPSATGPAELDLYCDPVDGTLNAARGGPRAVSVVGFGRPGTATPLFDDQAIFAVGSHSQDVSAVFNYGADLFGLIAEHLHRPELMTATLNREDNLGLLGELAGQYAAGRVIGSRSGYRPTIAGPGWSAVGDTTIPLPFECDLEFGRIGLVEAQIQSALYPSWSGLVVSRDRIRTHPGGLRGYLQDYLHARTRTDRATLRSLFTARELARFDRQQMPIEDLTAPLRPDRFGAGAEAVIAIAAVTGLHDPVTGHPADVLHAPVWHSGPGRLEVDTLTTSGGAITRRAVTITPADTPGLQPQARAWYRTLHWSDVPGAEDLSACAEGRNPNAHNLIEARQR